MKNAQNPRGEFQRCNHCRYVFDDDHDKALKLETVRAAARLGAKLIVRIGGSRKVKSSTR